MFGVDPVNTVRMLTCAEVQAVIESYAQKCKLPPSKRREVYRDTNHAIFRLALLGLRVQEICGLNLGDIVAFGDRPCIRVRKEITKGVCGRLNGQRTTVYRGRQVPLWWDTGSLAFLRGWVEARKRQIEDMAAAGVKQILDVVPGYERIREAPFAMRPFNVDWRSEPVIAKQANNRRHGDLRGIRFRKLEIAAHWKSAISALGPERVRQLSIHTGRHTFISHAIAAGIDLPTLRLASGHANLVRLSAYAHSLTSEKQREIYGFVTAPIYAAKGFQQRRIEALNIPDKLLDRLADWAHEENMTLAGALEYAIRSLVRPPQYSDREKAMCQNSPVARTILHKHKPL